MAVDVIVLLETTSGLVASAIALWAVYRSLTIGKSLVSGVYRSRAYWLAALMIIYAAFSLVPATSAITSDINSALFFVFMFALLLFIDSNVAVAREIDFFHKDILHWHAVRIPLIAIMVAGTAIGIVAIVTISSSALSTAFGVALIVYFALLGVVFTYSGVAMLQVARRTYDRTMKKFVKMLGFAILCYVLFLTLFIPLDAVYPSFGDVVTDFIAIAAAYFFYRAAMSLSFVGRIVKEEAA